MEKIAKQLTELIGGTPLLELSNYEKKKELKAQVVAKLEYFNPLGSVKDRVANAMIEMPVADWNAPKPNQVTHTAIRPGPRWTPSCRNAHRRPPAQWRR